MGLESFSLTDKNGNKIYFGDYGLNIGYTTGGFQSESFLPGANNNTISDIINMDGELFQNQNLKPRKIQISTYFESKTHEEMNFLKQILYCREPKQLVLDRHPYKYIWVNSEKEIELDYLFRDGSFHGILIMEYIAYNPLYYSFFNSDELVGYFEDYPQYATLFYDTGMPYVEDVPPVQFTDVNENGSIELFNGGNYKTKVKIELEGSCTDLLISNVTNDLSFTISNMNNEEVVVDGIRGQIRDDVSLKTNLFDGDFIMLEPGSNIITLLATSVTLTNLKFVYKYTYI